MVEMTKRYAREKPVQSVERTLRILEALAEWGHPMSLSEISSRLDLKNSTTHRLLRTLILRGFAQQDPNSGKYKLGIKTFSIGNTALYTLDIRTVARTFLKELVFNYQETANLAILDGWNVIYIDQVESEKMVKTTAKLGSRCPSHCSAVGKVVLASFPQKELELYFKECTMERFTSNTIVSPDLLKDELRNVKEKGFALDLEETEEGIRCVAAPIFDHTGSTAAAIGISGPSNRINLSYLKGELAKAVTETAREISFMLGCKSISPK